MRWLKLSQLGNAPGPRSSHSLTAVGDDFLVLFGGEITPRVPVNNVLYVYELATGTWSTPQVGLIRVLPLRPGAYLRTRRAGGCRQTVLPTRTKLFASSHGVQKTSCVHHCHFTHVVWFPAQVCGQAPTARVGHGAAAIDGKLYIYGGRTEVVETSSLDDLFCFDLGSHSWTKVEPASSVAPPKRNYHAMTAAGRCLYVFGGCGDKGRLNDLWAYDVDTNVWRELPAGSAMKVRK